MLCRFGWVMLFVVLSSNLISAQTREEKVRQDRLRVETDGFWIYNDLSAGFDQAEKTGKPLLIAMRCIPCEECVKLDDDLVDHDSRLRPLLEKFVRVRKISTNHLDLETFQFDTDQSFAVFLMNADGSIYGRYGTRSDQKNWSDDVSIEGLASALEAALTLHANYPQNQSQFQNKKGSKPEFRHPEDFPMHQGKFGPNLDYSGNVVKSCIHCHQIGDAQRDWYRKETGRIPESLFFPYPHPKSLGLILDPKQCATVLNVEADSWAMRAGFQVADEIVSLNDQPLLSIADIQWVLQQTPASGGILRAKIKRDGTHIMKEMTLDDGWRQADDIAWRASSWQLRRMGLGGLFSKPVTSADRETLSIPSSSMALRIMHVGAYPPHDVAKKAGFQKDDIILSFDGKTDLARETDLLHYAINQLKAGTQVQVGVLRNNSRLNLELPIPE